MGSDREHAVPGEATRVGVVVHRVLAVSEIPEGFLVPS